MARSTKVITICDLHRGEVLAAGTVAIVINGEKHSLDVCADHMREVKRTVRPWTNKASHHVNGNGSRKPRRNPDAAVIRAWAIDNGYELSERGRIPADISEAFAKAH